MKPVDVLLKINKDFGLMETVALDQLRVDAEAWQDRCTSKSESKFEQLYAKFFKENVFVQLLMPLVYFWGVKEIKNLMSSRSDEDFELDD